MTDFWHFILKRAAICLVIILSSTPFHADALTPDQAYDLRQAIAAFDDEPDVYQVQQAALRHRDFDADDLDQWTRRARFSTLLPQVQGQVSWLDQRDQRNRFNENIRADDHGEYERNYANHHLHDDLRLRAIYSLRLNFNLSDLVFHRQELAIEREVQTRWSTRDELLRVVTDLYFTRRRHQLYLRLLPSDDMEENLDRHLAIEALTARIDALTGGWFRSALEES